MLGAGNVKRVLEIFRGVRNLTLTNDESFGVKGTGKAMRQSATVQQKTIAQFYTYTSIVGHKDAGGVRTQFQVLWSDSSLTWEDAKTFERDVVRAEGPRNNVIVNYEKELAKRARAASRAARSSRDNRAQPLSL